MSNEKKGEPFMKENKLLLIGAIIISISIIIGCVWIGNSISKNTNVKQEVTTSKALMTGKETSEYLNMTQEKFNSLITYEESQKHGSFDTYTFIPLIKVDGVKYFNKEQVDKWVEYHIIKGIDINTATK